MDSLFKQNVNMTFLSQKFIQVKYQIFFPNNYCLLHQNLQPKELNIYLLFPLIFENRFIVLKCITHIKTSPIIELISAHIVLYCVLQHLYHNAYSPKYQWNR